MCFGLSLAFAFFPHPCFDASIDDNLHVTSGVIKVWDFLLLPVSVLLCLDPLCCESPQMNIIGKV